VEAMACGTPTIAFRCGSVPEIIQDGVTGFVVDSEVEAVAALKRVPGLSRASCRATVERRFTAYRMAKDYLCIYEARAENSPRIQSMEISSTVLTSHTALT